MEKTIGGKKYHMTVVYRNKRKAQKAAKTKRYQTGQSVRVIELSKDEQITDRGRIWEGKWAIFVHGEKRRPVRKKPRKGVRVGRRSKGKAAIS